MVDPNGNYGNYHSEHIHIQNINVNEIQPINSEPATQYNNTEVIPSDVIMIDTFMLLICLTSITVTISKCLYLKYVSCFNSVTDNASINPIDNLQTLIITNNNDILDDVCSICLEEFKYDEELKKLKCDHIFHKDCLEPWLTNNNKCPICRAIIN